MSTRTTVFKQYTVTIIRPNGVECAVNGDIVAAVNSEKYNNVSAVAVTAPYSRRLPAETWLKHLRSYISARPQMNVQWRALFDKQPEVHIDKRAKQVYILWHTDTE